LEVTTTGLLETGIGALPTGGASIAVGTVDVLISFAGLSIGDDSMTCFDKFLLSDEELFFISSLDNKNLSKQVIESSPIDKPEKEIKTSTVPTAILAPPVGSAPIPVSNKPVVVTSNRVQPAAVHSTVHPSVQPESVANTAEVIKPQEAVLAVSAVKAASPITAANTSVNSFTTPGGWNSAIISKTAQTTDKPKTELTLEERVKKLEEIVTSMKSTYDNKLEALQKDLDTERAERKKLEDQLRMARY
jgi:hypothetical protein